MASNDALFVILLFEAFDIKIDFWLSPHPEAPGAYLTTYIFQHCQTVGFCFHLCITDLSDNPPCHAETIFLIATQESLVCH